MTHRLSWAAASATGLLVLGAATAASAAGATTAGTAAGPQWRIIKSVSASNSGEFTAVAPTGKTTGWAFDSNLASGAPTAWRRSGNTWTKASFPAKSSELVIAAGAGSPADVWAFTQNFLTGGSRVLRLAGGKWKPVKTFSAQIGGADVVASNDVWVFGVSFGTALGAWHYDGHQWKQTGKNLQGGSALSATDAWAFNGTSVDHWDGHHWTATSVKALLPKKSLLNNPVVTGILELSPKNVYAIGNGSLQDEGGPTVVLHFNGTKWQKAASGQFGFGGGQQLSTDGKGGLWLPMPGVMSQPGYMVHYSAGKLTKVALPKKANSINVVSIAKIPGTDEQLAGGFAHAPNNPVGSVLDVILQYS